MRVNRKSAWIAASILGAVALWAALDLYGPRRSSLRSFDPQETARLDTEMWRSYYAYERLRLFRQLAEMLRTQYRLPFLRSNLAAYYAAKAAFAFKDGHSRADYERALPSLSSYYAVIRGVSDIPFDTDRAARLELEWWIVHRERASYPPGALDHALAEAAAELYREPAERLLDYGRLRAEAMRIRDTTAAAGGVTEPDWTRIDQLLHASWLSLSQAVNAPPASPR